MPLPAAHFRPVQSAVKTANAKVWGVAALPAQPLAALPPYGWACPLRVVTALYRAIQRQEGTGAPPHYLMCHCEEQSDVAISGRHFQFVQGVDKNAPTDCVCSGAPCAAVGGFAALRMGVPLAGSDRLVQSHSTAGGHWCTAALPDVSLRGAKRRGNLGKALPVRARCR